MKILGEEIPHSQGYRSIYSLKFLTDNPRVYEATHGGVPEFGDLSPEQQQDRIYEKLKKEPSVTNLISDVERHKGLVEPILVSFETMEVIDGNSRLAVYRILHERNSAGEWDDIPCLLIKNLTPRQREEFLSQIHVKGRTDWSAYEKANFAYVRKASGRTVDQIAKLFGESENTVRTRISAIEMMKQNGDDNRSHFSYYDVLVRDNDIRKAMRSSGDLRNRVLADVKALNLEPETRPSFKAKELRDKLPDIIRKPKIMKRYAERRIEFSEAYERAKMSPAEDRIRDATWQLGGISKGDIDVLDQNSLNALKQQVRKLERAVKRVRDMVDSRGGPG